MTEDAHLQDKNSSTFADDKAFAICIKRPRCLLRGIIESRSQTTRASKASDCQRVNAGFRATGHHHIGIPIGNESGRVANGVSAGGTCSGCGVVWALELPQQMLSGAQEELLTMNPYFIEI